MAIDAYATANTGAYMYVSGPLRLWDGLVSIYRCSNVSQGYSVYTILPLQVVSRYGNLRHTCYRIDDNTISDKLELTY
jgi:hypothetical protein